MAKVWIVVTTTIGEAGILAVYPEECGEKAKALAEQWLDGRAGNYHPATRRSCGYEARAYLRAVHDE